jgi:hypothetical protein
MFQNDLTFKINSQLNEAWAFRYSLFDFVIVIVEFRNSLNVEIVFVIDY